MTKSLQKKRILTLIVMIGIMLSFAFNLTPVSAHTEDETLIYNEIDEETGQKITTIIVPEDAEPPIAPRYEGVCYGRPYHEMIFKGSGKAVYVPTNDSYTGSCFQCRNCHQVAITAGEPRIGQTIGLMAVWDINYQLQSGGHTVMYTNYVMVVDGPTLEGYMFY